MMNQKNILSLFSGCGGMDLGFEGDFEVPSVCVNFDMHPRDWYENSTREGWVRLKKTSFHTVFSNDILTYAESAWKNFFSKRNIQQKNSFHKESIVELVKKYKLGEFKFPENIDVVTGGFPCQDFSVAGKRNGFSSHKSHENKRIDEIEPEESRGSLYLWMKQVIEITQPKVFIAENVKGLISLGDAKTIIEDDFRNIGDGFLVVPAKVLKSSDYGVAQNRERIIFIGLNKAYLKSSVIEKIESGQLDVYPPITHAPINNLKTILKPYSTVGDILKGLLEPNISNDEAQKQYSKAKYCKGSQGQREVDLSGQAPTIRAEHHGNIEYRRLSLDNGGCYQNELENGMEERRLTVRECARIQSFPDDYEFVFPKNKDGHSLSASGAYKVIGNAVPPLMAFNIAKHLESIWDEIF